VKDVDAVSKRIANESVFLREVREEVERVIVGQAPLIEGMLIGLLADGHVLIEGVPGLAKSLAVHSLASALGGVYRRIQFTPDLLPADLVGTHVYDPRTGGWSVREGPVFANFLLADEINRAPPKVQSALLEAMQERQVTLAGETRRLPEPFLVLATQNPVEQEGTYPLPEAQVDRFMLKLVIKYPTLEEERRILEANARTEVVHHVRPVVEPDSIRRARQIVDEIYVDDKIKDYILSIVFATRDPAAYKIPALQDNIRYGASPRATLYLTLAARAHAFLHGRGYVTPQDVKSIAPDVLRHRIIPSFEAEAEEMNAEKIVATLLNELPVP
jgi:MoxR-like ATPase